MKESDKYKTDMRALRQRVRLKISDVAAALGVSNESISAWEIGKLDLKLKVEQIATLLEIYDISFADLLEASRNTERRKNPEDAQNKMMVA